MDGGGKAAQWITRYRQSLALIITILVISAVTAALQSSFLTVPNLRNILGQISVVGILSVGMTIVMIGGGIDLSIGALVSLVGVIAGNQLVVGAPLAWVLPGAIALGGAVGALLGLVIAKSRVQPFVVTLGALSLYQGLALLQTSGRQISLFLEGPFKALGTGSWFGIPIGGVIFVIVAVAAHLGMTYTRAGRNLYAIGDNEAAAFLSGLRVDLYKVASYAILGALGGLAAMVLSARIGGALPLMGSGLELQAIAAVVIGGVSLFGGRGSITGAMLGVVLLGLIQNSLNLLQIPAFYQQTIVGLIILIAVLSSKEQRMARL